MSKWFDLSNNANKLRQSYVSGFLDISGGGVYLRSDNSLNLYSLDNEEVPKFSIKAQELRVRHGVGAADVTDVSNEKLRFIVDLSENVQDRLEDLKRRTKFLDTTGSSMSYLEDVSINRTLRVANNATFESKIHAISDASFDTTLNVDGTLTAGGATTLKNTLGVDGVATFNNKIHAVSDASFDTTLNVDGTLTAGRATTLKDTLDVTGIATFNNKIHAVSDASFDTTLNVDGTLTAGGATTLKDTLGVTGVATFNDKIHAVSDASFDATLTVDGITTLKGDTTIDAKLAVSQDASFNNRTQTAENATFDKQIIVDGDASLNSNLVVKSNITADRLNINKVHIDDNEISVDVGQDLIIKPGNNSIYTDDVDRFVRIIGDLKVDGSINFTGDYIKTDTIVRVTEQMDISNNGSGPALIVTQHGAEDIFKVVDDLDTVMIVKDGGNVGLKTTDPKSVLGVSGGITVGSSMVNDNNFRAEDGQIVASQKIGIGKAPVASLDVNGTTAISGATTIGSTLGVTGVTTLGNNLDVTGATTLGNTLDVTGATTLGNTLGVTGDASFNAGLSIDGNLNVDQAATITGKFIAQDDASLNKTLTVGGATSLGSTLGVTGAATLNSSIHTVGDASFDSVLKVDGATTLKNTLDVTGIATFNDKIHAISDASFDATLTVDGATSLKNNLVVHQNATVLSNLGVNGYASVDGTLTVGGATEIKNTLDVVLDASFGQKMKVHDDVSMNKSLTVATDISTGLLNVDKIHINDNYIESDVGQVLQLRPGKNTAYNNIGTNSTDHKVHIVGDLTVDGSINFTGDFIQTDTIVKVTEQLDISNDGTGPAVIITQYGNNDIMKVLDGAQLTNIIRYYVRTSPVAPYYVFSSTSAGTQLNNAEHDFILIKGTTYEFYGDDATLPTNIFAMGDYIQPSNALSAGFTNNASAFEISNSGSGGTPYVTNGNGSAPDSVYSPLNNTATYLSFTIPSNYNGSSSALAYFNGSVAPNSKRAKFSIVSRADSLKTRLIVKDGGFVGIGTDAPTNTLDVNGAARIRQSLTVNESLSVNTTLDVTGAATFNSGLTITSGNLDMSNNCYINQVLYS